MELDSSITQLKKKQNIHIFDNNLLLILVNVNFLNIKI